MENIEENVVEQGVVLCVVIKLQSVVVCSICKSLFVVKVYLILLTILYSLNIYQSIYRQAAHNNDHVL